METVHLTRWSEFVERTDALQGWAFRGQVSAAWPLVPSLTRRLQQFSPDQRLWKLREMRAMRVFRRKAHIYLRDRSALEDELRCLALMQHHGAPTRLLDFTKSPFVAAFFALESATCDVAVFALNTPALWNRTPDFDPALTRTKIDPRVPGNFERYFAGNKLPLLWFGEPSEMDSRLVAQSGLFVLPGVLDQPLDAILEHYGGSGELVTKFVLPLAIRDEAMRALYRMNVTYASLFPDLEGLARSANYELEVVWERLVEDFEKAQSAISRTHAEGPP